MLWNACILISDSTRFFICILNVGSLQFDEEEYPAGRVYLFNGSYYFPYCCLNRLSLVSLNNIGLGESLGRRKLLSKNDRTEAVKFMIQEFCYTVDEEGQHNKCVPTHATQTPVGNESSNLVLSNSTIPGVIETSEQLSPQSIENDEVFLKNHTKRNNKIETNIEANTTSIIDTSINSEDISLNLANSSFTLSSFSKNESLQQRKDIETKIQESIIQNEKTNYKAKLIYQTIFPSSLRGYIELPLHDGCSTPEKFTSKSSPSFSAVNVISVTPNIWRPKPKNNYKPMVCTYVDEDLYSFKPYGKTMKRAKS